MMSLYQERIYWHIRKFVFDHDDANDIVQNTFIKAFRGIGGFRSDAKLYTWLYKIASNESITFLKKKSKRQTDSLEDEDGLSIGSRLRSDAYFDGDHAQETLQKAIANLPDKQRLVFNMRYYDELPYNDISTVLGTSVGALKASYHHAVKKIEQYVKETFESV
ncbi:MAG: sigma-70 family RNA polymerase sigma factor [Saprospiraceae bacterium]|nr:sigma-70 family RNA polymerase sigma factor [Saprospiraceae bacterium]